MVTIEELINRRCEELLAQRNANSTQSDHSDAAAIDSHHRVLSDAAATNSRPSERQDEAAYMNSTQSDAAERPRKRM
jgi:hypothetical protein